MSADLHQDYDEYPRDPTFADCRRVLRPGGHLLIHQVFCDRAVGSNAAVDSYA